MKSELVESIKDRVKRSENSNFVQIMQFCMLIKIQENKNLDSDLQKLVENEIERLYEENENTNIKFIYSIYKVDIVNLMQSFGVNIPNQK